MRPGDRVQHPDHGTGSILSIKPGRKVRVRFDAIADLPWTVSQEDLELIPDPEVLFSELSPDPKPALFSREERHPVTRKRPARRAAAVPKAPAAPLVQATRAALSSQRATEIAEETPAEDRADLRQTIEALRLGVVPSRFVRDYTVARDAELASTDSLLQDARGLRVLWGDYGHGKTHLLDIIERVALERGFLAARITLDPAEVPATHPKRLYRAIVSALVHPRGGEGLEPLMHRLVDSPAHRDARGERASRFLSPWLFALHRGDEELVGWARDYASGDRIDGPEITKLMHRAGWTGDRLLTLSDFRTYSRMYVHLLGTIASWAKDAGYPGLLLLLDEVEMVDALNKDHLEYAVEMLKHFAAITLPESAIGFDPERELYRGGHAVHRAIPLRFEEDQPLAVVLALTPLEYVQSVFRQIVLEDRYDLRLGPLQPRHLGELIERVSHLYARAHPELELEPQLLEGLVHEMGEALEDGPSGIRELVRGTVLHLDAARLGAPKEVAWRM